MEDHRGDSGFMRSGARYRPSFLTPLFEDEEEIVVDDPSSELPSSIAAPLIWDMDGGYGAMKMDRLACNARRRAFQTDRLLRFPLRRQTMA